MAKRSPVDEKPFRPLDVSVLNSVMRHRVGSVTAADFGGKPDQYTTLTDLNSTVRPTSARGEVSPRLSMAIPAPQRLDQEKRILFTREETQALDRLVNTLAMRLRTQVKASHILRALTSLLLQSESQLDKRAGELGTLPRPPNGDFAALQRFERELSIIVAHAMRDSGLPRI